ncbi:hypothetical protein RHOFW104T7_13195 [Rhodanobacter thiooxydans]|uniref:Uncharacterized protein n=1 Tax=Rhodanobacter thiooxydans TaxID=416169 RepID=A0A154QI76_9GAMM|nr:hypothetical protein [Rhodanobacter thiooxydans]KZC23552.1 hypothetical protein RHOFW104T7_13195 [Rhodanobacter thiooxydans]
MSYTKPDQAPFTVLQPNETVVTLDTGDNVAVRCESSVEPNSGNPAVAAFARVVDTTGADKLDGAGQPIKSAFTHCSNPTEVENVGGASALQKLAMLAVLGESTAPLWQDPIHATVLENASIRTNITAAAHAGPVTDPGALL